MTEITKTIAGLTLTWKQADELATYLNGMANLLRLSFPPSQCMEFVRRGRTSYRCQLLETHWGKSSHRYKMPKKRSDARKG